MDTMNMKQKGQGYSKDVVAEIRRVDEQQTVEEARNPLAGYSTRQLKAELARRGRQPKWFDLGMRF